MCRTCGNPRPPVRSLVRSRCLFSFYSFLYFFQPTVDSDLCQWRMKWSWHHVRGTLKTLCLCQSLSDLWLSLWSEVMTSSSWSCFKMISYKVWSWTSDSCEAAFWPNCSAVSRLFYQLFSTYLFRLWFGFFFVSNFRLKSCLTVMTFDPHQSSFFFISPFFLLIFLFCFIFFPFAEFLLDKSIFYLTTNKKSHDHDFDFSLVFGPTWHFLNYNL